MRRIEFTTFVVLIMTLAAAGLFIFLFAQFYLQASDAGIDIPANEGSTVLETPYSVEDVQNPLRLVIPRIGIDTKVQHVGITNNGNMAVPNNFSDVGWYKHGTVPGRLGSAVMAGHVDNAVGLSGVFKRLNELKQGDEIFVKGEDGREIRFVVTDIESYPYEAVPTELIFNAGGAARLNLITCAGNWIQSKKTYDTRLVVFAELRGAL